ncbi:ABC transporter substrate-binding protein [Glutamicibacter sp. Je.9.36]|uniref:ABC transporter substrate-binding protein n=1 Tax=Glutamicibacter sp. Je.9.36 TaxID=3142837 RepID=UPI003DA973C3
MFRKKILALSVASLMALSLTACDTEASAGGGSTGEDGSKPYVAVVSKGFQHQFWQSVKQGAEKAGEEFDVQVSFEGPDTETDVAQQIEMLSTALSKNPDAIGIAALDSQAATPALEDAKSRNIPVIAFDSGVESDIPVATAATDNKAAAAIAAEHMAELIGGKGKIAIVAHDQTSTSGQDRRDGFVEYLETNNPEIEIVTIQYGAGDQLESANLAKTIINGNPDLAGIYGTNEGSAIGVVKAVEELNKADDLVIVGFDSGKAQMDAIRSGVMDGAVTQNPVGIGYETVKAAASAIKGEELMEVIDTGAMWYDDGNIDDPEVAANLYE